MTAAAASAPLLGNTITAKATTDGEDILTPLIEQEAIAMMPELTKKQE